MTSYTRDYFKKELELFYFDDWITESSEHAQEHVYKGLTYG